MSGPEVVLAAEAAAATTTAAEAAATAEAISAAIAAAEAEAAIIAAEQAAAAAAAESAAATGAFDAGLGLDAMTGGEGLAISPVDIPTGAFDSGLGLDVMTGGEGLLMNPIDAARIAAEQEVAQINAMNAYAGQIDPFQQFLKYGYEDAPGSTMRSIQSGFANNPLNTLKSLPQFMGMPAAAPSTVNTAYGANLAKQLVSGSGKPQGTSTTTTQLRPGQQVNMTQPIASLLAPKIRRKRGISLI